MLEEAWALSPSAVLRQEPFGALAYHFGNRRLIFLKRPDLVAVVRALGEQPDVRSALRAGGVPDGNRSAYVDALMQLARADIIRRRVLEEGPSQ